MSIWTSPLINTSNPQKIGSYDGCETALSYSEFDAEYKAIREGVAVSDQSHYGKFRLSGSGALDLLNKTNLPDIARLAIGKAMTSLMLNEDGSVLADVYVISIGDAYLLLTEGESPEKIAAHLKANNTFGAEVENLTEQYALIGIDGPYAWELLKELFGVRVLGMRYLEFLESQEFADTVVHVIRAGKTGEFGYLMIAESDHAGRCWSELLSAGEAFDGKPVGFDTLDVCRMENRFLNLHQEGSHASSPLELNCRVLVDHEKEDYLGRDQIEAMCEAGAKRRIVGMCIDGDRSDVPELGASVEAEGDSIGVLVNVGYSPALASIIGLAHLDSEFAYAGMDYAIAHSKARTVSAPFIFNKSLTVRPQEDSYHAS